LKRLWPGDGRDHADREFLRLQHRALLDVHLDVAEQIAALVRRLGQREFSAKLLEDLPDRDTSGVASA
jgi:hypothetical protein